MTAQHLEQATWIAVCADVDVPVERGVAVLLSDGRQIALFRTFDGQLHALSNRDPFSGANVLARGIVGTRAGMQIVISPVYKQAFDLATGRCLDDDTVTVDRYPARLHDGRVEVLL